MGQIRLTITTIHPGTTYGPEIKDDQIVTAYAGRWRDLPWKQRIRRAKRLFYERVRRPLYHRLYWWRDERQRRKRFRRVRAKYAVRRRLHPRFYRWEAERQSRKRSHDLQAKYARFGDEDWNEWARQRGYPLNSDWRKGGR